jgi:hypothetical protein
MNHMLRSTEGWSMINIFLDIVGSERSLFLSCTHAPSSSIVASPSDLSCKLDAMIVSQLLRR